jgi:SNF2 family DNA or RNA helicase
MISRDLIDETNKLIAELSQKYEATLEEETILRQQVADLQSILGKLVHDRNEVDRMVREKKREVHNMRVQFELEEAKRQTNKAREPDLNNPDMQKILAAMADDPAWMKLRNYQKEDLILTWDRFLRPNVTNHRGVFNANATSLGKTAESAMTVRGLRVLNPKLTVLWLTKDGLTKSSARQCKEWGLNIVPLRGTTANKKVTFDMINEVEDFSKTFITNYETLNTNLFNEFRNVHWDLVIVDEMHRLRGGANPGGPTMIWKNFVELVHKQDPRPFLIMMSGSLINNGKEELWAFLHPLAPDQFPSLNHFKRVYLNELLWNGDISKTKLMDAIAPNFFRKTKQEVGYEMQEKIYVDHNLELEPGSDLEKFYKKLVRDFMITLESLGDKNVPITSVLAMLHYQRAALVAPGHLNVNVPVVDKLTGEKVGVRKERVEFKNPLTKLEYAINHIFELVTMENENVIVYSAQYNAPIAYLRDELVKLGIKVECITGDKQLTTRDHADIEASFQQNDIQVVLINLKAGAEGLNLHKDERWPGGSSNVIFLDRWWNPALMAQGEDRAWRLGCLEPVTIHHYMVDRSVDLIMQGINEMKIAAAEEVTESSSLRASEWRAKITEWMKK